MVTFWHEVLAALGELSVLALSSRFDGRGQSRSLET